MGADLHVSIVIPTLNSERLLERCLKSINEQGYPSELIEIIVADGGSTDNTRNIASKYGTKWIVNHLRTGEAGKAVGASIAVGDVIGFVDSDNALPSIDWLTRIMQPFDDQSIIGSEPLYWDYEANDLSLIDRYCALSGVNDPLCLFIGNYGRYSYLTGKWTGMKVETIDRTDYIEVVVHSGELPPTMGANGFFIRSSILKSLGPREMFFDIDLIAEMAEKWGEIRIARVRVGITHYYAQRWSDYRKKASRRADDFLYHSSRGERNYPWGQASKVSLFKFILTTSLVIPAIYQALIGYMRKPDRAWLCHPRACVETELAYNRAIIKKVLRGASAYERNGWRQ